MALDEGVSLADRRLSRVMMAVAALCGALILSFGYGRDQGIYALVARTVLEGGMPYRDVFDFKPPGIFLIYALARALFGSAWWGIRVLEVAGLVGSSYCMVRLAERWWGDRAIGYLAAALGALVHAQLDFWHTAQPETFGGMLSMAALLVAGRKDASARRWLAAGVLFGLAGLLKPPLAGGGAVLSLWAAAQVVRDGGRPVRWRSAARPIGWVLLGGVTPFVLCLGWFWAKGAIGELYQALFVFTPHYTALGWQGQNLLGMLYQAFVQWLHNYCSLLTIGLFVGLACWRQAYRREGVSLLAAVVAIQLVGVALQGKFFPYHYAGCWPMTAMLAALGWWEPWRWARRNGRRGVLAFAGGMLLATSLHTATKDVAEPWWRRTAMRAWIYATGAKDRDALDGLASAADVSAKGNRMIAGELRSRIPPDGYVYIWGFEPVVYDLADRRFASRYVYNVPQRVKWSSESARRELLRHLGAHPPAAIVVAYHDVFPMVTGNAIGSSDVMERDFPELRALLDRRYAKLKRVDDFDLYLPRGE